MLTRVLFMLDPVQKGPAMVTLHLTIGVKFVFKNKVYKKFINYKVIMFLIDLYLPLSSWFCSQPTSVCTLITSGEGHNCKTMTTNDIGLSLG